MTKKEVHFFVGSSESHIFAKQNTKPVNALCYAVAGPHVAQLTCESSLSRVLPTISMGMFRLAHSGVVARPCFM